MKVIINTTLFALALFVSQAGLAANVKLRDARVWVAPDHTRVIFEASRSPGRFRMFTLANPPRVVLDIRSARLAARVKRKLKRKGVIARIRTGRRGRRTLRIVFDLTEKIKLDTFVLKPNRRYGHRLVIDLLRLNVTKPARRISKRMASKRVRNKRDLAVARKVKKSKRRTIKQEVRKSRRAKRHQRNVRRRAIRRKKVRKLPVRDIIVAIDPGHGGDDPGAIGRHGTREKDVVLRMAKRLAYLIRRQPGMQAVLIRNGDYYVDLERRKHIARKIKADLFISLHANSARRRSARGISVYTLSRRGASTEAARWLASRENRADLVGGARMANRLKRNNNLARVLLDLSQASTLQASKDIARYVLGEMRKVGRVHRRGLERAGFVVLKSPDIPSILIETGFISNPREERKLGNRRYQRRLAYSIMRGIMSYFRYNAPPNTRFARSRHVISNGETLADIAQRYRVPVRRLRTYNQLKTDNLRVGSIIHIPLRSGS